MRNQERPEICSAQHMAKERGLILRNTIGRWLAAITVGGGLLAAASPAIAAQAAPSSATHALSTMQQARAAARDVAGMRAAPDAVGEESQICLTNAPSYCIKANGTGYQVSVTDVAADKANFTVVYDAGGYHAWEDGNNNCLREGNNGIVKIENGSCNINDYVDVWLRDASTGNNVWHNYSTRDIMYATGDDNGDNVFASGNPPSGSWTKWNAPT